MTHADVSCNIHTASSPPKAPEIVAAEKNIAERNPSSDRLYQLRKVNVINVRQRRGNFEKLQEQTRQKEGHARRIAHKRTMKAGSLLLGRGQLQTYQASISFLFESSGRLGLYSEFTHQAARHSCAVDLVQSNYTSE